MKKMFPGHPLPPELPSGKENVARALTEHLPFMPHWDEKKSPTEKGSLPLLYHVSCLVRCKTIVVGVRSDFVIPDKDIISQSFIKLAVR